jgi:hypothetical protein
LCGLLQALMISYHSNSFVSIERFDSGEFEPEEVSPMKPVLCFSVLLLALACAIHLQAQEPAESPSSQLTSAPAATAADTSTAPEAAAELPEAPRPEHMIDGTQLPLIKPAAALREAPRHRFFDKTNLMLHLGVMAGETGDLISTRSIFEAGGKEANPIAKPLMQAGLGGQMMATYGLGEGTTLLGSYLLHRTGHHRLERFVPITAIIVESLATASNIRTRSSMHGRH